MMHVINDAELGKSFQIKVLDKGYVRLIDFMGGDEDIIRAARVSYDKDARTGIDAEKDRKLLEFLYDNHHTTPFEAVEFKFEVKAPIFVVRQWHRHRTWSYNEVSARYTALEDDFYVPDPAIIGAQSLRNKQGRNLNQDYDRTSAELAASAIKMSCERAFEVYNNLLMQGTPRELARTVLPTATYTRMVAKVDLHNLMHFFRLRCHEHAQWEIQQYAYAMMGLVGPIVPWTMRKFKLELTHSSGYKSLL